VFVPFEGGRNFHNGRTYITSAERLIFPVYFNNSLVGWQMRSIPGTIYGDLQNVVKYYHLFHKGDYLYNYDNAKKFKQVIVVEGVKKALKFPNSVATWGCCISKNQLKLIQTWPEVVMLLDSDKNNDNTQKMANKFVDNINLGGSSKAINIDLAKYDASSPDDLPKDILQEIVDNEWRINVH
jgi:DNA primase